MWRLCCFSSANLFRSRVRMIFFKLWSGFLKEILLLDAWKLVGRLVLTRRLISPRFEFDDPSSETGTCLSEKLRKWRRNTNAKHHASSFNFRSFRSQKLTRTRMFRGTCSRSTRTDQANVNIVKTRLALQLRTDATTREESIAPYFKISPISFRGSNFCRHWHNKKKRKLLYYFKFR